VSEQLNRSSLGPMHELAWFLTNKLTYLLPWQPSSRFFFTVCIGVTRIVEPFETNKLFLLYCIVPFPKFWFKNVGQFNWRRSCTHDVDQVDQHNLIIECSERLFHCNFSVLLRRRNLLQHANYVHVSRLQN